MVTRIIIGMLILIGLGILIFYYVNNHGFIPQFKESANTTSQSEDKWKKILTPEQYHILREKGTEVPFTGSLLHNEEKGTYYSVGCDKPLFRSEQKYDSGTGWPSFWAPIREDAVVLKEDYELGQKRVEVLDTCGGHLGHVFDDGPEPTGKRYCMNSIALRFVPDKKQ